MVGDNGEAVADEVLSPFLDRRGDGKELSDIRGGSKKLWSKSFDKEGDGMSLL